MKTNRRHRRNRRQVYYLDVNLHKSEDMQAMEAELERMRKKLERMEVEVKAFSLYAAQNLDLLDDLREARRVLERHGIDSSFLPKRQLYRR